MPPRVIERILIKIERDRQAFERNSIDFYFDQMTNLGCWPQDNGEQHNRGHVRYWLPRFAILTMGIGAVILGPISVYTFWNSPLVMIMEAIVLMFVFSMLSIAIASFLYQQNRFQGITATFNDVKDFLYLHKDRRKEVEDEVRKTSELIFFNWYLTMYCIIIPIIATPVLVYALITKKIIFSYWLPNQLSFTPYFEITVVVLLIGVVHSSATLITIISLYMTLLVETVGHLKLLSYNLKSVSQLNRNVNTNYFMEINKQKDSCSHQANCLSIKSTQVEIHEAGFNLASSMVGFGAEDSMAKSETKEERLIIKRRLFLVRRKREGDVNGRLKICIRHHQAIIKCVEQISSAFELFILQLVNCCVFPVVSGMIGITNSPEFDSRMLFIALLVGMVWNTLTMFTWMADKVTEQGDLVREAVFGCDWLRASDRFKRSMRIIMSRSNQPLVLKVGGFIPLNMETFYKILKLTYSYYMSLRTTLHKHKW